MWSCQISRSLNLIHCGLNLKISLQPERTSASGEIDFACLLLHRFCSEIRESECGIRWFLNLPNDKGFDWFKTWAWRWSGQRRTRHWSDHISLFIWGVPHPHWPVDMGCSVVASGLVLIDSSTFFLVDRTDSWCRRQHEGCCSDRDNEGAVDLA